MLRRKKYYFFYITIMLGCINMATAQQPVTEKIRDTTASSSMVIVGDIVLRGNKKTREAIVLREIPFKKGDEYSLEELVKKFEQARIQLMNTALFRSVVVAGNTIAENRVSVTVELKERWYLYPLPQFRPVDRNLNQWIVEHKASLSRVNYGIKFYYNNATGRDDKLRLALINGYTKQLSFSYDRPYIDKRLKWGIKFAFATGKNREINYNTVNDKQVFLKDENNYVRNFTNAGIEFTYRRAIKTRHSWGINYVHEQVSDTVIALNPSFFKSGRNHTSFPVIYYNMNYRNLDFNPYPTKGYAAQLSISKSGFNNIINMWQFHAKGLAVWPLSTNTFFSLDMYGGVKLPFKQPYYNRRFLGYGDAFLQGYEYYVIDGVAGGFLKTTFTRKILNFAFKAPPLKKGKQGEDIPVRIFGRIYGNTGYVHDPEPGDNSLSNRMLYSGGIGIDILAFYNLTFKLDWSFNSLGQNGLFLHY